MLKLRLFPLMEADGAGAGGAGGADNATQDKPNADEDKSGQRDADERKTGDDDVKAEAQKLADGMLAKKMKGMPSKEELAAYKKWQDERKTESDKLDDAKREAQEASTAAAVKETKADAMIAAVTAGIKTEHIEDTVILAMARVSDDITIEDAIKKVAKNNPTWTVGVDLPKDGGNPAKNEEDKKTPPILI